ncbi:hypothetical protein CSUI_006171 [Cystoisospora suis]|uniref:FAD-binding FR-type domain-containing protein n=1 Tax=Cystoisospora suis TaxID=483139 RepID=A0A2C6KVE5_9APIC|nr:hypothetical protein CSUI_006171 [Cystoisospora suis]
MPPSSAMECSTSRFRSRSADDKQLIHYRSSGIADHGRARISTRLSRSRESDAYSDSNSALALWEATPPPRSGPKLPLCSTSTDGCEGGEGGVPRKPHRANQMTWGSDLLHTGTEPYGNSSSHEVCSMRDCHRFSCIACRHGWLYAHLYGPANPSCCRLLGYSGISEFSQVFLCTCSSGIFYPRRDSGAAVRADGRRRSNSWSNAALLLRADLSSIAACGVRSTDTGTTGVSGERMSWTDSCVTKNTEVEVPTGRVSLTSLSKKEASLLCSSHCIRAEPLVEAIQVAGSFKRPVSPASESCSASEWSPALFSRRNPPRDVPHPAARGSQTAIAFSLAGRQAGERGGAEESRCRQEQNVRSNVYGKLTRPCTNRADVDSKWLAPLKDLKRTTKHLGPERLLDSTELCSLCEFACVVVDDVEEDVVLEVSDVLAPFGNCHDFVRRLSGVALREVDARRSGWDGPIRDLTSAESGTSGCLAVGEAVDAGSGSSKKGRCVEEDVASYEFMCTADEHLLVQSADPGEGPSSACPFERLSGSRTGDTLSVFDSPTPQEDIGAPVGQNQIGNRANETAGFPGGARPGICTDTAGGRTDWEPSPYYLGAEGNHAEDASSLGTSTVETSQLCGSSTGGHPCSRDKGSREQVCVPKRSVTALAPKIDVLSCTSARQPVSSHVMCPMASTAQPFCLSSRPSSLYRHVYTSSQTPSSLVFPPPHLAVRPRPAEKGARTPLPPVPQLPCWLIQRIREKGKRLGLAMLGNQHMRRQLRSEGGTGPWTAIGTTGAEESPFIQEKTGPAFCLGGLRPSPRPSQKTFLSCFSRRPRNVASDGGYCSILSELSLPQKKSPSFSAVCMEPAGGVAPGQRASVRRPPLRCPSFSFPSSSCTSGDTACSSSCDRGDCAPAAVAASECRSVLAGAAATPQLSSSDAGVEKRRAHGGHTFTSRLLSEKGATDALGNGRQNGQMGDAVIFKQETLPCLSCEGFTRFVLTGKRRLSKTDFCPVCEFRLRCIDSSRTMNIGVGQVIQMRLWVQRYYTPVYAEENNTLVFAIRIYPTGELTPRLLDLPLGGSVLLKGPFGIDLVAQPAMKPWRQIVLIAFGTGSESASLQELLSGLSTTAVDDDAGWDLESAYSKARLSPMLQILQHAVSHWNIPERQDTGRSAGPAVSGGAAQATFRNFSSPSCVRIPEQQHSSEAEVSTEECFSRSVGNGEEPETEAVPPTYILLITVTDQVDSGFYTEGLEALQRERSTFRVIHHIQEHATAFVLPSPPATGHREAQSKQAMLEDERASIMAGSSSGFGCDALGSSHRTSSRGTTRPQSLRLSHVDQFPAADSRDALTGPGVSASKDTCSPAWMRQLSASQLLSSPGTRGWDVSSRSATFRPPPVLSSILAPSSLIPSISEEIAAQLLLPAADARVHMDRREDVVSSVALVEPAKSLSGDWSRPGIPAQDISVAESRVRKVYSRSVEKSTLSGGPSGTLPPLRSASSCRGSSSYCRRFQPFLRRSFSHSMTALFGPSAGPVRDPVSASENTPDQSKGVCLRGLTIHKIRCYLDVIKQMSGCVEGLRDPERDRVFVCGPAMLQQHVVGLLINANVNRMCIYVV